MLRAELPVHKKRVLKRDFGVFIRIIQDYAALVRELIPQLLSASRMQSSTT